MAELHFRLDKKAMDRLIRESPARASAVVRKLAFDVQAYAQQHMSMHAPSAPGEPPAVVTGSLRASITVRARGPFTQEIAVGAEYGAALEFGTIHMAARPFLTPAMQAIEQNVPEEFKAVVRG